MDLKNADSKKMKERIAVNTPAHVRHIAQHKFKGHLDT